MLRLYLILKISYIFKRFKQQVVESNHELNHKLTIFYRIPFRTYRKYDTM